MPKLSNDDIKKAIDDGRLTLLSLDTSIFEQYKNGLEYGLLHRLAQFSNSEINVVLSDVVIEEVRSHMLRAVIEGDALLSTAVKKGGAARNIVVAERQEFLDRLTKLESPEICVDRRLATFKRNTSYIVATTGNLVSIGTLFSAYFNVKPPFENAERKKHEFPDAMALQGLEAYAAQKKNLMLVVSADNGWEKFCDQSDWLVFERDLAKAMGYFQLVPSVVCSALAKRVADGTAPQLHSAIENELISFVEGMDIYANASAGYYYEDEIEEKTCLGYNYERGYNFILIDSDEDNDLYVFEATIETTISVSANFSFQIKDEGEYFTIGGAYATTESTQRMSIAITISGDPRGEFDVDEVEVLESDNSIDFGSVEPDFGDERYED